MSVPIEKLLALKAFYLGHAAAESASRPVATAMITAAIEQLRHRTDVTSCLRLAFYLITRAEILRHGGDPVPDRQAARELCVQIESPLYDLFMTIEEATMTKKKARGIQTLVAADEGIHRTHTNVWSDGFHVKTVTHDIACSAVGIDEGGFTESELHFLRKTSIKEMLDKHGIVYP